MQFREKNDAIKAIASVTRKLDRLQVELCEETPYDKPSTKEIRERIVSTFEDLDKVWEIIQKQ